MDIRVLVFNSGTFNRAELSKMSEQELWQLWEKDDDQAQVQMYYLDEFSCAFNDEEVSDQDWLYFVDYDNVKKEDAGDGYSDTMQDKLSWLLQSHYNTFHADMIQRAMNDDSISAEDFIKGCVAIHTSERDTDDDEFTPAEFENEGRMQVSVKKESDVRPATWTGKLNVIIEAARNGGFAEEIEDIDLLSYSKTNDKGEKETFEERFDYIDTTTIPVSVHFICGTGYENYSVPIGWLTDESIDELYECVESK